MVFSSHIFLFGFLALALYYATPPRRHAATPENTDLNSRQLRFLRLVEPVVSPVDAAVHGDRLRLR